MNQIEAVNNLKRRLPSVNAVLREMGDAIRLRGHSEVSKAASKPSMSFVTRLVKALIR